MPHRCPSCGQYLSTQDYPNPLAWNPVPIYELYCKRCGWRQWYEAELTARPLSRML